MYTPRRTAAFYEQGRGHGKNDVHIHLTYRCSEYQNILAFRDYLRSYPDEAANYQKQKYQWLKSASGHRQFYTASKNDYIAHILLLAKPDSLRPNSSMVRTIEP
jgi:GrpB-like predicted nucleotidyltransferase (UPF0157 family)